MVENLGDGEREISSSSISNSLSLFQESGLGDDGGVLP